MKDKDNTAIHLVEEYILNNISDDRENSDFTLFIVWKAKIVQNWKYLISSTRGDGMYYELTYNGDKNEWYLDAYEKVCKQVIKFFE